MTEYSCGFLFDKDRDCVLLVNQSRPEWQRGCLNGIGGKVEDRETPLESMIRTFKKTTGLDVKRWSSFCTMRESDWAVHFFFSIGEVDLSVMKSTFGASDEAVMIVSTDKVNMHACVRGVDWLIPMALTMPFEGVQNYEVLLNCEEIFSKELVATEHDQLVEDGRVQVRQQLRDALAIEDYNGKEARHDSISLWVPKHVAEALSKSMNGHRVVRFSMHSMTGKLVEKDGQV